MKFLLFGLSLLCWLLMKLRIAGELCAPARSLGMLWQQLWTARAAGDE